MAPAMRLAVLTLAALTAAACSDTSSLLPDTGLPDTGPFSLSGKVEAFPLAASWFDQQQRAPPSAEGLLLHLEDPYVRLHVPDAGTLTGPQTLSNQATYSFVDVSGTVVSGVSAVLRDPRPALDRPDAGNVGDAGWSPDPLGRVAVSSEQMLLEGKTRDLSGTVAWTLPMEFVRALGLALGEPALESRGFLLGLVLDADGKPVAGAQIATGETAEEAASPKSIQARLRYLGQDLTPVAAPRATTAAGSFVVVGAFDLHSLSIVGRAEYPSRRGLATPSRAFLVTFRPQ